MLDMIVVDLSAKADLVADLRDAGQDDFANRVEHLVTEDPSALFDLGMQDAD